MDRPGLHFYLYLFCFLFYCPPSLSNPNITGSQQVSQTQAHYKGWLISVETLCRSYAFRDSMILNIVSNCQIMGADVRFKKYGHFFYRWPHISPRDLARLVSHHMLLEEESQPDCVHPVFIFVVCA